MTDETEANQAADDVTASEATGADETEASEQQQTEGDEGETQGAEDEDEEVDLDDDLKLRVPKTVAQKLKELKEGNLRQADYTRKTMELAEQRKAEEAERQAYRSASEAERKAEVDLRTVDAALAEMSKKDWDRAYEENPYQAGKDRIRFDQLKDLRANISSKLDTLKSEREATEQQETAKLEAAARAAVERDIPDWKDVAPKVETFAMKELGFSQEELDSVRDPRVIKLFHRAYSNDQAAKKAKAAANLEKAQEVVPAAKVGGGKAAPPTGLDDRLSQEEWLRRRNKQVRA